MRRKRNCQKGYKMNSQGSCISERQYRQGGKVSRHNRGTRRRMPMGGIVRGNPNSRRVMSSLRDGMQRFWNTNPPPGLMSQVSYLQGTRANLEAYLRGQGPQWQGGTMTNRTGGRIKKRRRK